MSCWWLWGHNLYKLCIVLRKIHSDRRVYICNAARERDCICISSTRLTRRNSNGHHPPPVNLDKPRHWSYLQVTGELNLFDCNTRSHIYNAVTTLDSVIMEVKASDPTPLILERLVSRSSRSGHLACAYLSTRQRRSTTFARS